MVRISRGRDEHGVRVDPHAREVQFQTRGLEERRALVDQRQVGIPIGAHDEVESPIAKLQASVVYGAHRRDEIAIELQRTAQLFSGHFLPLNEQDGNRFHARRSSPVRFERSHAPLYNNQARAAEVTPSGSTL
jgi:hypothetical protein